MGDVLESLSWNKNCPKNDLVPTFCLVDPVMIERSKMFIEYMQTKYIPRKSKAIKIIVPTFG